MWQRIGLFLEMIRFSHTIFALPFALSSATLAWYQQSQEGGWSWEIFALQLGGILLAMVLARSTAMGFNRLVDRKWDALNPRTAGRHIPAGTISVRAAWFFTLATGAGFLASTGVFWVATGNIWPLVLALPVLFFLWSYSFTKRFSVLAHFWLGTALSLAPLAAWVAIRGLFPLNSSPLALALAVLFWVAGFDILYACQDLNFDRQNRLKSIPAWLGLRGSLGVALTCHLVMILCLAGLFLVTPALQGTIFKGGLLGVVLLIIYEHGILRPDDLSRVNEAFFQVNGVISLGLFLTIALQLTLGW